MADRNTPKDGYTQLSLIDMFRRARSNGGGSSPGGRGRQDNDNNQRDSEAPENRGGRSSRGGSHSSSRHSNSPGSRPGGPSRRPHHRYREGNRDRDRDRERRHGQGRRLGGNAARREAKEEEEEEEGGESAASDSMDIEMGKDVPLPQGTSSMLRADAGRGNPLRKMNMVHSHVIVAECPQISQAVFGKKTLGFLYNALDVEPLGPRYCPGYRLPPEDPEAGKLGCRIRVVNQDTFACAEEMIKRHNYEQSQMEIARKQGNTEPDMHAVDNGVVCLNMANARSKGGGFHHGSVAQEEVLMHRSTLYDTLDSAFYPWTDTEGVYSPWVAIYKKYNPPSPGTPGGSYTPLERAQAILSSGVAITDANKLGMPGPPLPELAVISIAAIQNPATVVRDGKTEYAHPYDEDLMQLKIRQLLRIAGLNGHRRLVLGALGCGAFGNPKQAVAELFLKVLKEPEFQGGWWKEITFACFDRDTSPSSNPYIFGQVLGGVVV
ncbi:hypothetical protein TWF730_001104 [Orbilia blumenaviensis]|uniref:Microbial-type PARG catalytic domain-containing protein n=1 Tax=Orbilia blumenaviensis TaxID=1796055 RepID=A0AAV9VNK9_9PEZI